MKKIREIGLYILFGGLTTLVNFLVYSLLAQQLGITLSNAVAWVAAVLFAFFTNRAWVFQSQSSHWMVELWTFVGGRVLSGALEIFLPGLLVGLGLNQMAFDVPGFWAKVMVSILVVILNYIVSKFIVFKNRS